jgi:hypothetical protein
MSALLAFVMAVMANTQPTACASYDIQDETVVCDGVSYPMARARITHDSDDGDIMAVGVWQ